MFISSSSNPTLFFQFYTLQKGGRQLPIHRSHSVPVLNKDGSVSLGGVIRVIPSTPRAMERTVSITSCTSPKDDNGNFTFQLFFELLFISFSLRSAEVPGYLYFQIVATFNSSFATSDNQPMPYLSSVVQREVMMMVKILPPKRLFVEFA